MTVIEDLENKLTAARGEIKLLKDSNKKLRQRLTEASHCDRNKLVREIALFLEEIQQKGYQADAVREMFLRG